MREVIFFDVDNTLVDSNTHQIPSSTIKALHELGQQYDLAIATGRALGTLVDNGVLAAYPWSIYVCNNGQLVYNERKEVIYAQPMNPQSVQAAMRVAKQHQMPLLIGTPTWYQYGEVNEYQMIAQEFFHFPVPEPIQEPFSSDVFLMVGFGPKGSTYPEYQAIDDLQVIPGQSTYCDLIAADSGKAKGIEAAQKQLHFPSYLACGDSDNDLGMFAHARYAIAMGQGSQAAKQCADYITKAVDEDGIYHATMHCEVFKE